MNGADVDTYETLTDQLRSSYAEISTLSKKSPNDAVNLFKLRFINSTLNKCNHFFEEYKPFADFTIFDEDSLPSNSDVTFIISQYLEASEKFHDDNIYYSGFSWYWSIDNEDEQDPVKTYPPRIERKRNT